MCDKCFFIERKSSNFGLKNGNKMKNFTLMALILVLLQQVSNGQSQNKGNNVLILNLNNLKQIARVDERYQSVNIEMCEVVGGDFWIPYELLDPEAVKSGGLSSLKRTIPPVDLYEPKIRMLASALGPMYIRVSGTWANTTYFQDNNEAKLTKAPSGFENVLTRAEWKGVIDFCKAVNGKLVTSFAICDGIRDSLGNWTSSQIDPLINYTISAGGKIYAAEMFNEPSHAVYGGAPKGYNAEYFARDFAAFKKYLNIKLPDMKIMGPGSTGEGGILFQGGPMSTDSIMNSVPRPHFDIFSYHFYGGVSKRCMGGLSVENALTREWLSRTEAGLKYYEEARNKYNPDAPIWLTETAESACGGNPWAATWIDCFRYLEQLGRLAKKGVQVVMHNTLCASEYALLEQDTHDPRPNYWAALLWNKLMGTNVYDAGLSIDGPDIFIHNLKNSSKGFAVLVVNPENTDWQVTIPSRADQYLITANELQTKTIELNGKTLKLKSDETLPEIKGVRIKAGNVVMPPYSIMFLAFNKIR